MSKKITHKEVEKAIDKHTWLTGKLADWSGNDLSDLEEGYDFITNENIIINYIKQQDEIIKKQQKLLESYKELATLYRDRFDYTNSATEIQRLWVKIKELENEKSTSY